jgi:uncharacterized membrane protein
MMHGHGGFGGQPEVFGVFSSHDFVNLILVGLVLVVVGLFVSRKKPASGAKGSDQALLILKEQFAKGEIDEATYAERRRVLSE